jgi:hypothetical protein
VTLGCGRSPSCRGCVDAAVWFCQICVLRLLRTGNQLGPRSRLSLWLVEVLAGRTAFGARAGDPTVLLSAGTKSHGVSADPRLLVHNRSVAHPATLLGFVRSPVCAESRELTEGRLS